MSVITAAIVFLVPLALAPAFSFYFDVVPKIAVVLFGAALLLLAEIFAPAAWRPFTADRFGRLYSIGILSSVIIVLATTALSPDPLVSWNGSNWRRFGACPLTAVLLCSFLMAAHCARSPALRVRVLRTICVTGLIAGSYGVLQYFGMDPLLSPAAYQAGEGAFTIMRLPGTLGHSDYFGAWLLWPFFAGIALSRLESLAAWKILARLSSFAAMAALLLTGSRGAVLGLMAGLCLFILLARVRFRVVAAGLLCATAAIAIFIATPAGGRLRARLHWISDDPTGGARLLLWRDSIRMSLDRPLQGFGPERFAAEFPKHQSTALARAFPDFYHESPHNAVLDALISSGVLAVVALLLVFAIGLRAGLRRARTHHRDALAVAVSAALVATFVAQQFIVFTTPTALYFYLGAGMLAGLGQNQPTPGVRPRRQWAWAAVSIVLATVFVVSATRLVVSDHLLATARHKLDSGDVSSAAETLKAASRFSNTGINADLYFARRWVILAASASQPLARFQFAQFARMAALASTAQPDEPANSWYNLAVLDAANNDAAGAESSLRSAIGCAPKWFKPHWALARLLFVSGHGSEARNEAAAALEYDAGKDPEVTSTLMPILHSAPHRD